jgi:hypothetical protein
MNALEHAVIEAARAHIPRDGSFWPSPLETAVKALEQHEAELAAAGMAEVDWALVTDEDELRSKSGAFFPVTATKREWRMGKPTGNFLITVQLPAGPKILTRPNAAEPTAVVRRGAAGRAVDTFVHVFSSGDAT